MLDSLPILAVDQPTTALGGVVLVVFGEPATRMVPQPDPAWPFDPQPAWPTDFIILINAPPDAFEIRAMCPCALTASGTGCMRRPRRRAPRRNRGSRGAGSRNGDGGDGDGPLGPRPAARRLVQRWLP